MSESHQLLKDLDRDVWSATEEAEVEAGKAQAALVDAPPAFVEKRKKIVGFTVIERVVDKDNSEADKRLQARKDDLKARMQRRDRLRGRLRQHGIEPLAILPAQVWEAFCDQAKLYRFETMDSDGKVLCKNRLNDKFVLAPALLIMQVLAVLAVAGFGKTPLAVTLACLAIAPLAVWGGFRDWAGRPEGFSVTMYRLTFALPEALAISLTLVNHLAQKGLHNPLGLVCLAGCVTLPLAMMIGHVVSYSLLSVVQTWLRRDFTAVLEVLLHYVPRALMNRTLWPERYDKAAEALFPDEVMRVEVNFPTPPESVAATLQKAQDAGLKMSVAAVSEAVIVDTRSLAQGISESLKRDPIVYLNEGDLVAVIAQFGDFAGEKEVIRRICGGVEFL